VNLVTVAVKNVRRNAFRNALTVTGVAVAMLAFVLLRTVLSAWTIGAEYGAKDRVATRHKVSFVMSLPRRYVTDVQQVPGIKATTWMNWFGAKIKGRETEFFANMACDPATFLEVYDEISLPPEQKAAFLENRQGAILGVTLAKQLGWKVGDHVTLQGTIFPGNWEFDIVGIYTATQRSMDQSSMFFNWAYMNESLSDTRKDQVGWIVSRIGDPAGAATVSKRIDALFDVRDIQTISMDERALQASFLGMFATLLKALDVISIVILAIMLLILGNTIAMGVRERTQEYGVLRAIGFLPKHITLFIVGEAAVVGLAGALIGVGLSIPLINGAMGPMIEENMTAYFPYFRLQARDALVGLAAGALLAMSAAVLPARRAAKLQITQALRRVG